jgi:DNA-binding NtrC family response regulator
LNILIIENEVYLAQSIASRLLDLEHTCTVCISIEDSIRDEHYDIVLLSTNINGQDFLPVIERYKKSIILMMVSYVSNDTVALPLSLGAKDYLLKPFMIDDLIRKINHYIDYEFEKQKVYTYEKYLATRLKNKKLKPEESSIELPLFIFTHSEKDSDTFAYQYAFKNNMSLDFIILSDDNFQKNLDIKDDALLYIKGFTSLNETNRKLFLQAIKNKNAIIENNRNLDVSEYATLEIDVKKGILSENEILPIEEYIKFIISNYQYKFSDTKLAEILGISRKSIWEKRKKHGIKKL